MPRVIITVPEKNAQPYRFQLDRKVVSLGRGSDNDIVIESGSVSGKHAEMHRVEGGYELADLGSTNGIKYNGTRKNVVKLRPGMTVKLGGVAFDFSLTEEELEILGREKPMEESPIIKELEESTPSRLAKVEPSSGSVSRRQNSFVQLVSGDFGMIFLFMILAAGAFFVGLGIRHEKETGESLIHAMSNKDKAEKMPLGEEPAAKAE